MISKSTGMRLPEGLDVVVYDKVNEEAARLSNPNDPSRPSKKNAFVAFAHAWQGVASRFGCALEDNVEFKDTFQRENTFEVLALRQKYLFRCATSMVSTIECLYFAAYCISTEIAGAPHGLNSARDLNKYPVDVANRFFDWCPTDPLSKMLLANATSPLFLQLCELRDTLSHRGTIQELIEASTSAVSVYRHTPVNPKALPRDLVYANEYSPKLTQQHINWMKLTVARSMTELAEFLSHCQSK